VSSAELQRQTQAGRDLSLQSQQFSRNAGQLRLQAPRTSNFGTGVNGQTGISGSGRPLPTMSGINGLHNNGFGTSINRNLPQNNGNVPGSTGITPHVSGTLPSVNSNVQHVNGNGPSINITPRSSGNLPSVNSNLRQSNESFPTYIISTPP